MSNTDTIFQRALSSMLTEIFEGPPGQLRREAEQWRNVVAARMSWDGMGASAALSTAAHTAYHLGAIRQILSEVKPGP
jgi:hypothetical protein